MNDKDIETLIAEGEQRAKKLSDKANQVSKEKMNMLDFQMNNMNLYNFEDVDYAKQRRDDENNKLNEYVKQMITEDSAMRGNRKAKQNKNLSEANLCPKIFAGKSIGISEDTKKKKIQIVQDFRFFPNPERLKELIEKEIDAKYAGYFTGVQQVEFTEEEKIEKETLLSRGFLKWDRRDFQKFLQSLEFYPRDQVTEIAAHIGTKTEEEVRAYQEVFYNSVDLLNEANRIQKTLKRVREMHNFKQSAPLLIKTKVTAVERPLDEMQINPIQKSKYFSKEADIVLLCLTHEHGYGNWNTIKHAIRRDGRVRFDHLLMSRSEVELQRRVDVLVKSIEKEAEVGPNKPAQKKKSKKVTKTENSDEDMDDVDMRQEDFDENNQDVEMDEDSDDSEAKVRIGRGSSSDNTHPRQNDPKAIVELGEDEFEGLEEAAKNLLKRPKLHN